MKIRLVLNRIKELFSIYKTIVSFQKKIENESRLSSIEQVSLMNQYNILFKINPEKKVDLRSVGFSVFSQHDEDGIILFIFSLIGVKNKICIELCAGNGIECNTANLIINHKWYGLLCDGNHNNSSIAKKFYSEFNQTKYWPPVIANEWLTVDNVNSVIKKYGFQGEIDLLSIDIDGIDYWLWEQIDIINPRVVVLEFNHLLSYDKSLTVPYDENFKAEFSEYGSDYAGASLLAFVKLSKKKGYYLLGVNTYSTNAFFIRNDIYHPWLNEVDVKNCFNHPRAKFGINVRYPKIKNKVWKEV